MPPSCAKVARTVRPPFPSGWASLPILPCDLTLAHTLPVGQSFVWRRRPLPSLSSSSDTAAAVEEFSRAVDGDGDELARVVCLRQTPEALFYTAVYPDGDAGWDADRAKGTTRAWLEDYFQLGRYPALDPLYAEWGKRDPKLFGKMPLAGGAVGVRVLRQDPWECLVSCVVLSCARVFPCWVVLGRC